MGGRLLPGVAVAGRELGYTAYSVWRDDPAFDLVWYSDGGSQWFDVTNAASVSYATELEQLGTSLTERRDNPLLGDDHLPGPVLVEDSPSNSAWFGTAPGSSSFFRGIVVPGDPFTYSDDGGTTWRDTGSEDRGGPPVPFYINGIAGQALHSMDCDGPWEGVPAP